MIATNNIFNIRVGKQPWHGQVGTKKGFVEFDTREHAIRAWLVLMRTYRRRYQRYTIRDIVGRFAPPNENNTNKYISFVERNTWCVRHKETLPPRFDPDLWIAIVKAMTIMECGRWNKKLEEAEKRGYNLAFNKE